MTDRGRRDQVNQFGNGNLGKETLENPEKGKKFEGVQKILSNGIERSSIANTLKRTLFVVGLLKGQTLTSF